MLHSGHSGALQAYSDPEPAEARSEDPRMMEQCGSPLWSVELLRTFAKFHSVCKDHNKLIGGLDSKDS